MFVMNNLQRIRDEALEHFRTADYIDAVGELALILCEVRNQLIALDIEGVLLSRNFFDSAYF